MADLRNDEPGQWSGGESCTTYASLLTALFDTQIDEDAARLARGHLECCARCADMWQAWEFNRSLLQKAPAPLPPVTLLARILLACRLMALTRRNGAVQPSRDARSMLHHSERVGSRQEDAAPSLLHVPPPPPDLHESILRLTTRRKEHHLPESPVPPPVAVKPPVAVEPAAFEPPEPRRTTRRTNWMWSRSGRLATLAVPVVLLWVSLITPSDEVPVQTATVELSEDAAASHTIAVHGELGNFDRISERAARNAASAKPGSGSVVGVPVPAVAKTAPVVAASAAKMAANTRIPSVTAQKTASVVAAPATDAHIHAGSRRSRREAVVVPVKARPPAVREHEVRTTDLAQVPSQAHPKAVTAPAMTTTMAAKPRGAAIRLARYVRPATPHATTMQERVVEPSEPSSTGIEILREVHSLDEGRSAEVRQVVEDYRASLISEIADSSEDDSEFYYEEN